MSRILLIYHYFHPDKVISARLNSDLAEALAAAGHSVTVFTANHCCRATEILPAEETWNGVLIRRFGFRKVRQYGSLGRLYHSAALQWKWLHAIQKDEYDVVILGTDPQFGYLMFPFLRRKLPKAKLIHWAFDLYPEAILATVPAWMRVLAAPTKLLAKWAYGKVDIMVDIGSCMRKLLRKYHHHASEETLTPWGLKEADALPPVDDTLRRELFGNAKLALLYSGTIGYAHDLRPFFELARECRRRNLDIAFGIGGYGNQYQKQLSLLTEEDTNIRKMGFCPEEELQKRLAAADFHLISLRESWVGVAVPSKFFGALAMGRPVLFSGPSSSCIAEWCEQYKLGFQLDRDNIPAMADRLAELVQHPEQIAQMQQTALTTYQTHFSHKVIVDGWRKLLTSL